MAKWLELRRHSFTKKGEGRGRGSDLSQEGIDAARAEGAQLHGVRYVGVSEAPRTMETAIAMGFAVDDVVEIDSSMSSGEVEFHEWWDWPNPWAVYRERIDTRPALAAFANAQVDILRRVLDQVADGETALLVGHGGWIEPTVVAAIDRADLQDWGPSFQHLEGVRVRYADERFSVELIHRRPKPPA